MLPKAKLSHPFTIVPGAARLKPRSSRRIHNFVHSRECTKLWILRLDRGFNLAAPGTIVNGCDSFAFGSMRILDGFFRVLIHDSAAIRRSEERRVGKWL